MNPPVTSIFLLITTFSFGQTIEDKTEEFLSAINCKEILNKKYNTIKSSIDETKPELFRNFQLDFNKTEDVKIFDDFLIEEIELFKEESFVQLSDTYSRNYSVAKIQLFINKAKNSKNIDSVLRDSNFYKELDSIVGIFQSDLNKDIKLTLTKIRAQYTPLKLIILENGNEINVKNVNLEMFLNTASKQNDKINILNTITSEISVPKNFDYDTIKSLTIKYNSVEYTIDKYNMNLPETVREISSPLKKDGFEDLEIWTLNISQNNISLKIKAEVIFEK
ncbi:hypothetical protein FLJC2902T_31950 [Flavobacterium limnosediminis JC2902]|uniref:Uncharacterized protein n=1 Tax=Flavobacterium limnosediminis JC2902 TaxID=1341181 RepID=V6SJD8_9FLAO|nr:hypothetical protein FLJC2902T_31950 [Flavobacterium limnosediminis JC2902]